MTFDVWPPNPNPFLLELQCSCVPNLKKFPQCASECSQEWGKRAEWMREKLMTLQVLLSFDCD